MSLSTIIRSARPRGARAASLLALPALALLAACDNGPSGPQTGKLSFNVVGLPSSAPAQITVTGPGGFSRTITAAEVVANLKPGNYTVASANVNAGAARYQPTPASQTISVPKSDTPVEVSVAYALATGTLAVNVVGNPNGSAPTVRVTGPGGFDRTISASTVFEGVDPGLYTVAAQEFTADQQRFSPSHSSQLVSVGIGLQPTAIAVQYSQVTGNITITVSGLPAGVNGDVTVAGPSNSYVVGTSGNLVGVRAGQYTITAKPVAGGQSTYIPNTASQTVTLAGGGTLEITIAYVASDGPLNLTIDGLYISQSVQTYSGAVPLVANRDGFIRVFGRANQSNSLTPPVRVRLYHGETLVHTMQLVAGGPVPIVPNEGSLTASWNGIVLAQYIQPGLRVLADIDPQDAVAEGNETDNTFPTSGASAAIEVRTVPELRVTFVPVIQRFDKTLVGNITEVNKDAFLVDARRMLPLRDIDTQIHAPYTTSDSLPLTSNDGNGEWLRILSEMNALRIAEGSQRHYYGVVKVTYNSGIAGYGYVPGRAAVGWDYLPSGRNVAAHEMSHNFGRFHAPCGGAGNPDPSYPYAGGVTGTYGFDMTTSALKLPTSTDIMSYCGNTWISDYTYLGIMNYRSGLAAESEPAMGSVAEGGGGTPRRSLLVWGRVEEGRLVLEPAFSLVTRPSVPRGGGRYRIEGLAADGRTLFSYSFEGDRPADAPDETTRHFAFAIPMNEGTERELVSLRLTGAGAPPVSLRATEGVSASLSAVEAAPGAAGSVSVRWGAGAPRMALIRDRRTGQVLSFARGASAQVRTPSTDLEVILSDGVRSAAREIRVRPR